jgi:tetratricopeptide (TPR) repeat protein
MKKKILTAALSLLVLTACDQDFLEKKPSLSLVVPTTIADFTAILDNYINTMNLTPYAVTISDNDFFMTEAALNATNEVTKNCYTWSEELFSSGTVSDWDTPYRQVFYANIVLDGISKISQKDQDSQPWQQLKSRALFHRAMGHFILSQQFAPTYNPKTAKQEMGIPLKLTSDVNSIVVRASIADIYDQITKDLKGAVENLPERTVVLTRPDKASANALLARVYLIMQDYERSLEAASLSLSFKSDILDYNKLDTLSARPFPAYRLDMSANPEMLYYSNNSSTGFINAATTYVDTVLYKQFHKNDLRRILFFNKAGNFKGSYSGGTRVFTGLTTAEVLLTRSECYARLGDTLKASADLNALLLKRFKTGTLPAYPYAGTDLLEKILWERRKELISRSTRWSDLRRLNLEERFAQPLQRKAGDVIYSLLPGSPRYVMPIPVDELLRTGLGQNPR